MTVGLEADAAAPSGPRSLEVVERIARLGERRVRLSRRGLPLLARYVLPACAAAGTGSRPCARSSRIRSGSPGPSSSWAPSRRSSSTRGSSSSTALFSEAGRRDAGGRRVLLRRTAGFDLHSVREYQQGESLRKVHWRTTAKRGALMVKELEDTPHDEVAVAARRRRRSVVGESFDVQVRAAGSILLAHAMRRGDALLTITTSPPATARSRRSTASGGRARAARGRRADRHRAGRPLPGARCLPGGPCDRARRRDRRAGPGARRRAARPRVRPPAGLARPRRRGELPARRRYPARPALLRLQAGASGRRPAARRRSRREAERVRGGATRPMARTVAFVDPAAGSSSPGAGRLEEPRPGSARSALMVVLGVAPALLPTPAAAAGRGRPRAAPRGRVRPRRTALFPRHAPRAGARARLPRLLRRDRPVRRRGASADARGRAARRLPLHAARRARRRGSRCRSPQASSWSPARAGPRRSSRPRRPRPRRGAARRRPRARRPADAQPGGVRRRRSSWAPPSSCSRSSPRAPAQSQRPVPRLAELGPLEEAGPPVSVAYVWKANYSGISFPNKRTRVFTVRGPRARSTGARRRSTRSSRTTGAKSSSRSTRSSSRTGTRIWMLCTTRRCSPTPRRPGATGARRRRRRGAPRHPPGRARAAGRLRERAGRRRQLLGRRRRASASAGPAEHAVHRLGVPAAAEAGAARQVARDVPARDRRRGRLSRGRQRAIRASVRHARSATNGWRTRSPIRPSGAYEPLFRQADTRRRRGAQPYAAAVAIEAWLRSSGSFAYNEKPPPDPGDPAARRVRHADQRRLLPALRGRDGAHAALSRDPRPGRRGLHERRLRPGEPGQPKAPGASTTATRTPGSRSGSRATAGCRSTRHPAAATSEARTRPPRSPSTPRARSRC